MLAGPGASRFLGEFGADVTKVNNTTGEMYEHTHLFLNRGKKHMLLDLGTPEGLEVFYKLSDDADIVMQNFSRGVSERLGVGYETMKQRNPGVLYYSLSCFGYGGTVMDSQRGHEPQGQNAAGLSVRYGGDGTPSSHGQLINDYGTAPLGAFSVALAYLQKLKTGESQHSLASLAQTSTFHSAPYLYSYAGRNWDDDPRGMHLPGYDVLNRLYKAADAHVYIVCPRDELGRLETALGLRLTDLSDDALAEKLEAMCAPMQTSEIVVRLVAQGIAAHRLNTPEQVMDDQWAVDRGLVLIRRHEGKGLARVVGPVVKMSRTPLRQGNPVRPIGADGPDVVRALGYDPDELLQKGIIRTDVPAELVEATA